MKILLFVHSLRRGGAERVLLELALGLMAKGHTVEVLSWLHVDEYQEERYAGVRRHFLLPRQEYSWPASIPSSAAAYGRFVRDFCPDVVELHTPTVAWVAAWAGIKVPYVHVLQGFGALTRGNSVKDWAMRIGDRWAQRRLSSRLIVPSSEMGHAGVRHFLPDDKGFACIPNGIDPANFTAEKKKVFNSPTIMMLGTLSPNKGQQWGIRAFAPMLKLVPKARLVIVGEGSYRPQLQALLTELGLEGEVSLPGRVQEVFSLMSKAHLFWHLSESEGLPMVVLEAMASGLPVIGFNVRGTKEVVDDGNTGYLLPFGDIEAVARVSAELLADSATYFQMAERARARVESRFSTGQMVLGHERVLASAASEDGHAIN